MQTVITTANELRSVELQLFFLAIDLGKGQFAYFDGSCIQNPWRGLTVTASGNPDIPSAACRAPLSELSAAAPYLSQPRLGQAPTNRDMT
jgi:hypothetical protein